MKLAFDLYDQGILLVPTKGRGEYVIGYSAWREKFPSKEAYMDVWAKWPQGQPEVLCGVGDVVALDIDEKNRPGIAALFDGELRESLPDVYPLLYVERTKSGGTHYFFKRAGTKSEDIAFSPVPQTLEEEFGGEKIKYRPIIEIKGEHKLCRVYPCEGIEKLQGDILALPVVSDADFQHIRYIASLFNEREEERQEVAKQKSSVTVQGDLPGVDYSNNVDTSDIVALLEKHGWKLKKGNAYRGRILLTRPGAKTTGTDADILNRVFCAWSSSVDGFETNKGYSFFAVFAQLEFNGDFTAAAKGLKRQNWGKSVTVQYNGLPVRSENGVAHGDGEPMTLWDEIQEEVRKSWEDANIEYTLRFRHQQGASSEVFDIGAPGMIVLVTGREKARKSAFVAGLMSANISGKERVGHTFSGDGVIIILDTEQSTKFVRMAHQRLMIMGGVNKDDLLKKVVYVPVSGFVSHEKRMAVLRELLARYEKIVAVVIDGDKDLVQDPNDLRECRAHISELRAITKNRGFLLFPIMHLNKGSDRNVSGHLGSEWIKACDCRLDLVYDEDTHNTNVSSPFSRGERVPPYTLIAKRGNVLHVSGYPEVDYDYQGFFLPKNFEGQIPDTEFSPQTPFLLPDTTREDRLSVMDTKLTDQEIEALYGRG